MQKVTIGNPVSPCKTPTHTEIKATKIVISFGGGMGGANKTMYASKIVKKGKELSIETIFGEKYNINSDFMVYNEPVKVIKQVTDITAHTNYHQVVCKKHICTLFFEIGQNEVVNFSFQVNTTNAKKIYSSSERV